jgi:aspartate racemase
MNKGRCLGLIGGLGVGAAVHYYRGLAKAHEQRGVTLDLVMAHAEVAFGLEFLRAGDRLGLAEYLNGFIQRLKAAGAEVAAIPAVTPHYCVRELEAISPLPLLNIFDPLVRELEARKVRRVAVFGTRYVMESGLYGMAGDVEIVPATPDEMEYIHATYMQLVEAGKGSDEQHRGLTTLAQKLCERDGVEAIVLAGTDLALIFDKNNTDFPAVDCAALHLQAIAKAMLE